MKKIVVAIVAVMVSFSFIRINPVKATEDIDDNLKSAVEELVKVKMIEWEIVFGLPLEDVALLGNLKKGRDIEHVVEYFEKYYTEDVLKEYLYYLKRSTTQELYLAVGVFWGSKYEVVGNSYKREATEVKYDFIYKSIEKQAGITKIVLEVTPTYYGDFAINGESSSIFTDNKRMVTLFLKEEDKRYKLINLDKAAIDEMEKEIGETIDLNQEKDLPKYEELEKFEYNSEEEKEGLYFAYDILTRLVEGGHDKLYDRYETLWLTPEEKDYVGMKDSLSLKNLEVDYQGWDYAYIWQHQDYLYKSPNNSMKSNPYQKKDILLFNVEGDEVVTITMMETLVGDIEEQNEIKVILAPMVPFLNNRYELLFNFDCSIDTDLDMCNPYLTYPIAKYRMDTNIYYFDGMDRIGVRLTDNSPLNVLIVDLEKQSFRFNSKTGIPEKHMYDNIEILSISPAPSYIDFGLSREAGNLFWDDWNKDISIKVDYIYERINYYLYKRTYLHLEKDIKVGGETEWRVY